MDKLYINRHIIIENNTVKLNGEQLYSANVSEKFSVFAKSIYKANELNYGKFYKMDSLSKLGFLAAELLLNGYNKEDIAPEETAIILNNASSSLHTDKNYQEIIPDTPSPAIFVYTLPNIVTGEICIRHNIKGEAMFFVEDNFDARFINNYVKILFKDTLTKLCITGWVEMSMNETYKAELFLVSENVSETDFNESNINI